MRLTALVENPDHVCPRYRLRAFAGALEQAGHKLELRAWPREWWSRVRLGHNLRGADAVIIQRKLFPGWQVRRLRRSVPRLLFDFDDAVFLRDSYSPKGLLSTRRTRRFAAIVRAADVVVAGNQFLANQAMQWTSADRVHLIPTCVDPGRYPLAKHVRAGDGVQLVWVGSSSTLQGLEQTRSLLEQIGESVPGLRLKMVCDRFLRFDYLPVIECAWSEANEAAEIAGADIGISWVPDDLWSRGKCGLKVLQYMAAGLPVVTNPVGVHTEMVTNGETGFLVNTPEQWIDAIKQLAGDPDLRRRMGAAGRRRVEKDYSVAVGAARWLALLEQR